MGMKIEMTCLMFVLHYFNVSLFLEAVSGGFLRRPSNDHIAAACDF